MRYEDLRSVLTEHFRQLLNDAKNEMNDTGPLNELDRQVYETSKRVAKQSRKTDSPLSLVKSDDDLLARFIEKYDLDIQKGSSEYGWLDREMKLSFHGFAKAVLAYDKVMLIGSDQTNSLTSFIGPPILRPKPTSRPAPMTTTVKIS